MIKAEVSSPSAGSIIGEAGVDHSMLWRNPSLLIDLRKRMLEARGESMAERLGECPLPVRIHIPIELSSTQIADLGLEDDLGGGKNSSLCRKRYCVSNDCLWR